MSDSNWWFGQGDLGSVVFDKTIQLNDESVLLYVLEKNEVMKYIASEVRPMLRKEANLENIEKLTKNYTSWKYFHSSKLKYLTDESPFSFKELKEKAESEHRKKLEKLGLPYKGLGFNSIKSNRATHCYDCKEDLDSAIDLECLACGWILCKCGACGCGYKQGT